MTDLLRPILRRCGRAGLYAVMLGVALPGASPAPAHTYRITGVAVSSRDGTPVPYCRVTASLAPLKQIGTARATDRAMSPAGPTDEVRGNQPDRGQGPPGGGRLSGGRQMGQMGGQRGGPFAVNRSGSGGSQPVEVTADASGHFTLELPRAGAWRLTATARGFRDQTYEEHDGFYSAVVLNEATPTSSLTFAMAPDSVLTGLIFDEAGEPVAAAQVTAELIPPPTPGMSALADAERPRPAGFGQTDDRGHYEIGGLAPGRYRLRVQAQPWYSSVTRGGDRFAAGGLAQPSSSTTEAPLDPSLDVVYPTTWYPGTEDELAAQVLALSPGEERQADFHLTAIPSVHLKIPRTDNGSSQAADNSHGRLQPQPRQQVMISRISADGQGFEQQFPGGISGNDWDFGGLTPGTYEVRMSGPDGRQGGDVRLIEVGSGSQPGVTMDSAKPLVRVNIRIDGVPDREVQMVEFVDTETGRRITSSQPFRGGRGFDRGDDDDSGDLPESAGRSVMLPPHQYEVYLMGNAADYLTGVSAVGARVLGRVVTIGGAATLTLKVANTHAQLDGVARIDKHPAEGAMVLLVPVTLGQPGDLGAIQRDETNTDGTFLIAGITPGRYILVAIDHGWEVDWRSPEVLAKYLMHGVPVDLRTLSKAHEEIEAAER